MTADDRAALVKEAAENPPIAELEEDRIANGYDYHVNQGWPQEKAATMSGASRDQIKRAVKRSLGSDEYVAREGKGGRPSTLSEESFQLIINDIEKKSLDLDSYMNYELPRIVKQMQKREMGWNDDDPREPPDISHGTFYNIRAKLIELGAIFEGRDALGAVGYKNAARVSQFRDIRNQLSMAAQQMFLDSVVAPEAQVIFDDFSILLHDKGGGGKIITTQRAKEILRAENLQISHSKQLTQQRVIQIGVAMHCKGRLVTIFTIWDRKWEDLKEKPRVIDLGDDMFAVFYHPSCPDTEVEKAKLGKCVVPKLLKYRQTLIEAHVRGAPSVHFEDSAGSQPTEDILAARLAEAKVKYEYMGLGADGASAQVEVMEGWLADEIEKNGWKIILFKSAAGMSMVQSPNDNGPCHCNAKKPFHTFEYKAADLEDFPEPIGPQWIYLKEWMRHHLDPGSFKTYWKAFKVAPKFLSDAFTFNKCAKSFAGCHRIPLEPYKVMSVNRFFRESLTELQCTYVVQGLLPQFAHLMATQGTIFESDFELLLNPTEEDLQEVLADAGVTWDEFAGGDMMDEPFTLDNCEKRTGMQLNDMVTNRQRAMIINHEATLGRLEERRLALREAKHELERRVAENDVTLKRVKCINFEDCGSQKNPKGMTASVGWVDCGGKWCRKKSCSSLGPCFDLLEEHRTSCNKL